MTHMRESGECVSGRFGPFGAARAGATASRGADILDNVGKGRDDEAGEVREHWNLVANVVEKHADSCEQKRHGNEANAGGAKDIHNPSLDAAAAVRPWHTHPSAIGAVIGSI